MIFIINSKCNNFNDVINTSIDIRTTIFPSVEDFVNKYYAAKFIEVFDYHTIFSKEKNFKNKIIKSKAEALEHINFMHKNIDYDIRINIFQYMDDFFIAFNIPERLSFIKNNILELGFYENTQKELFEFLIKNTNNFSVWSTVLINLSEIEINDRWIGLVPNLEVRADMQSFYFLLNHTLKDKLSIKEQIEFEKVFKNHPQFEQVKEKIYKIIKKSSTDLNKKFHDIKESIKINH